MTINEILRQFYFLLKLQNDDLGNSALIRRFQSRQTFLNIFWKSLRRKGTGTSHLSILNLYSISINSR